MDSGESDTFAKHFGMCYRATNGDKKSTSANLRSMMDLKLLWQGNPTSSVKSFGTLRCSLCMQERLELLKERHNNKLINENSEICGSCRHNVKFHDFHGQNTNNILTSADDRANPEKVKTKLMVTQRNCQNFVLTVKQALTQKVSQTSLKSR